MHLISWIHPRDSETSTVYAKIKGSHCGRISTYNSHGREQIVHMKNIQAVILEALIGIVKEHRKPCTHRPSRRVHSLCGEYR
jgi:hypothetical protein